MAETAEAGMVERVARALARHQVMFNLRLDAAMGEEPLSPDRIETAIGHAWPSYATQARIAIGEMREPSPAMVNKAWAMIGSNLRYEEVYGHLIDAALERPHPALVDPA